ncbi:MAG: transposase [Chitinophagaceae bacterium]|nr:transposase [Chitinophagaceae bacterium]MBN8666863.1 transposase [Chitinophagales bacterium]
MKKIITEWPQFYTATILDWKRLLKQDKYKDIVIASLRFLVKSRRVRIFGFVIMSNHIHLIWQVEPDFKQSDVKRDFLKYTAQKIKADLRRSHPQVLDRFLVCSSDRHYQFWKRGSLSVELRSRAVFFQKLEYIHWNPVKAFLSSTPEEYKYSSASFYETGLDNWGFLTHYTE